MTSGPKKFLLLLWKNYVLQKRHKIQTGFEIVLPLLFTAVVVVIRGLVDSEYKPDVTTFPSFDVADPSFSVVPLGCFILYAPNNTRVDELVRGSIMQNAFNNRYTNTSYEFRGYKTEEDLLAAYKNFDGSCPPQRNLTNDNPVLAAIVFDESNFESSGSWRSLNDVKYSLRFPSTQHYTSELGAYGVSKSWMTELLYPIYQRLGPRDNSRNMSEINANETIEIFNNVLLERGGEPGYWVEGYLYLQYHVEKALRNVMGSSVTEPRVKLNRFPYPPFIDDVFLVALSGFLPMIFVFSFIYSVINITKSVAHEKEKRLKESMKMMGLPNWLHWSAWFFKSYVFLTISLILMVIMMKVKWYPDNRELAVLTQSDGTLIFLFLFIYAFSMITFSFFISTLFSTANSAATAGGVLFFLTYLPYTFLQPRYDTLSKNTKLLSSLMCNTGLSFGCQLMAMFEGTGAGIQWSNLATTASPDDNITMLDILVILLFDGLFYMVLAIYVEGVWPGEYGLPLPWYFPFTKWYWFGTARTVEQNSVSSAEARQKNPQFFEKEPTGGKAGVQIQGLTKIFGPKTAVNNLYLNFYDNQITALLGHNGAGKTTTMSMLTGLFPPTSGTAIVNGFDIRQDIKSVRDNLGLCPQHDVLFDEMTVSEHLKFFCQLKGCEGAQIDKEVDRMLKAINLEMKRDAQAMSLSGGMKRRLSVGIAFVGGSRVVLLDEPSSGLDPGARRQVWDLIQKEKRNRTILLSTHFMDEADLLGDRIAIMGEGQVQCCGSSLFLKKKYGGGYHLIIVKHESCNVEVITSFLRHVIPEVQVDQNIGSELTYSLPDEKSHLFADMFEELEQRKVELGIDSYGASITTMEEVFMRVGKQIEEEELKKQRPATWSEGNAVINVFSDHTPNTNNNNNKLYQKLDRNEGVPLLLQQLRAMIVKKGLYAIRNKTLLLAQTLIPIAFLIITLIMLKTMPTVQDPPALDITLKKWSTYGTITTAMQCSSNDQFCNAYGAVASADSEVVNTGDLTFEDYVIKEAEANLPGVNYGYVVGIERDSSNGDVKGYFNNQPFHAPPVALNLISNALLKQQFGGLNKTIVTKNSPLPLNAVDEVQNVGGAQSNGFNIGFTISFGMSFLAASFVVFLIKERETNSKHLQVVSGVKFTVFWIASFIFDSFNFIIPCLGLMITLLAFQIEDFKSGEMQGYVFILLVMYGWGVIPFMYWFSFAFTIPSTGFTRMFMFNVFTGIATILAVSILSIPDLELEGVSKALEWIFMIFPNFNLGYGLSQLSTNYQLHKLCPVLLSINNATCEIAPDGNCCTKYPKSYLTFSGVGIGRNLLFLFLIGCLSFGAIFIKESKIIQRVRFGSKSAQSSKKEELEELMIEDSDVEIENKRIRGTNLNDLFQSENLILRDLTKVYGKFMAVDSLCLGVKKGECFGLLGINGAGKSTTFKMLTGDIDVTSGDAFIHRKSIKSEIKKVQQELGYCPQFDALIPELTGRETIRLFARLRGVKENEIDGLADALASKLLFSEHIDKACGTYSGGNKRKLSTSLALVGNPRMVLLDEPTTGMDPVARRHLWDAISDVREAGTSIVLTSHSMDECEALSTRLAIMVNGKFRCIGSTQHLKNKFGEGYTLIAQIESRGGEENGRRMTRQSLEIGRRRSSHGVRNSGMGGSQLQSWEQELLPFRNYVETVFPGAEVKDLHAGYVHYHIKDARVTWGYMFRKMEEAKQQFRIEAYSVGQTTLEQVFLNFTKSQLNADEE